MQEVTGKVRGLRAVTVKMVTSYVRPPQTKAASRGAIVTRMSKVKPKTLVPFT